jgi:flagellin-specific chaperone FliS
VATAQGDYEAAEQHLIDSAAILEEVADEYEWARSRLLLAQLYLEQGNPVLAQPLLDKAAEVFERLEASLDLTAIQNLRQQISMQQLGEYNG